MKTPLDRPGGIIVRGKSSASSHEKHQLRPAGVPKVGKPFPGSEVLKLLVHGCQNKEIAATLRISLFTVATHMVNIFEKLQVGN